MNDLRRRYSTLLQRVSGLYAFFICDSAEAVNADRNKLFKNMELQTFRGVSELMLGSINDTHTGLKPSHF